MIKMAGKMATSAHSAKETSLEVDDQKMKLLMVTLKEIGRRTSMMEKMERDAVSMLSRADQLQRKIDKLEKMRRLPKGKEEPIKATPLQQQESARISAMAEVQEMKQVILQEAAPSDQIQQMKDMVQMEIKHNQDMDEEIKMKELMHLKEKERQKELIKQIRLSSQLDIMTACLAEVEEEILPMKALMKTL